MRSSITPYGPIMTPGSVVSRMSWSRMATRCTLRVLYGSAVMHRVTWEVAYGA